MQPTKQKMHRKIIVEHNDNHNLHSLNKSADKNIHLCLLYAFQSQKKHSYIQDFMKLDEN